MKKLILIIIFVVMFSVCGYCRTVEIYLKGKVEPIIIENVTATGYDINFYQINTRNNKNESIKYIFPFDVLWQIIERE
uniref:Uncharacterized protein n=1 Tax=viral metagenome TaxID=1070528 RepID=A0A6M3IFP1_9ZZZZ